VLVTIASGTAQSATRPDTAAQLASGISDAFLAAGGIAVAATLVALIVLPAARTFLPKLRLAPSSMPIH